MTDTVDGSTDVAAAVATGAAGSAPARPAPARPAPARAASAASRARRIGGTVAGTVAGTAAPARPAAPRPPAAAPVTASAPAPDRADASAPVRRALPRWLRWAPAAILSAGAAVMAIVLAVVSHGVWWAGHADSTRTALREQVLAAAKQCLAATNTYTYTDIAAFRRTGAACTTGAFTTKFRSSVDTLITPNAPKLKFVQQAQINKAGIEAVSGGQWTVLLYGQLQITNVNQKTPRIDPFGATVRMERAGGAWRISSLSLISSPIS